ncbi:31939_t:CDS:2 [Gigaspora margarita]|uniref:31939_t:CDS:1 n=1 Tax=Gigaspora margarita TaxID=4874 RepID=A0ABM8VZJ5_GIGMA|nr:31939_t:CDS:2 [Gigaspora margarita]
MDLNTYELYYQYLTKAIIPAHYTSQECQSLKHKTWYYFILNSETEAILFNLYDDSLADHYATYQRIAK